MKVGLLGNMNNNGFSTAQYLRDRGVDAEALLFDGEPDHFHPSADCYDDSYTSFCRQLSWGNPAHWGRTSADTIRRELESYDVIVGCGFAPAYCRRGGRSLDVFVPFGGDLYYCTRYRPTYPSRLVGTWRAVYGQRLAIPNCSIIHMDMTNSIYEDRWAECRGASERWYHGIPNPYTGVYNPESVGRVAERTRWHSEFAKIRQRSDLLLFSHVRHVWGGTRVYPDLKGTDRLLRGVALFKKQNPSVRVSLVTFEYGTRVQESKALVAELGLEDSVYWFPKTLRKDLMCGVLFADIICAEFEFSWLSSSVVYEAMAMAKPILGFRTDGLYREQHQTLYPIMNAREPGEICCRLEEYLRDPARHRAMGVEGQRWYRDQLVTPTIEKYVRFIERRAYGNGAGQ